MHKPLLPTPLGRPLAAVQAALLALTLLLAQALGLLHRVEHVMGAPLAKHEHHVHGHGHGHGHDNGHGHDEHAHHEADGLFGSHDDAGDCRLFDQAATAEVVGAALSLVFAPPAEGAWRVEGRLAPRHGVARCYQARAPPRRA